MQHEARQKVTETLAKAQSIYGRQFDVRAVRFDLRGRVAGQYLPGSNEIRLNYTLLSENTEHFMEQTIPHEVAHLITRALYGSFVRSHGPEWKGVMRRLGLKPTRCHTYDTTNSVGRVTQKFSYFCACREIKVGAKINAKIQRGVVYRCNKCKTPIASQAPAMQLTRRTSNFQVD